VEIIPVNRTRFLLALPILMGFVNVGGAQVVLKGAGATFPSPLYEKWFAAYKRIHPGVLFDFQGVGSGEGQKLLLSQAVDFAASDAPMSNEAMANAPGRILHIPTVGGADVITFNLHGVTDLRLDGPTLAAIYLGQITHWNDPAIVQQNPGIKMPEEDITVVHRTDSSGTSYIFTDYLCSISAKWKLKVGRYLSVNWPIGVGLSGNDGVSTYIKKTPGAIGYVELLYAIQNQLTYAKIRNASGSYIRASTDSITAALSTATIPDDFRLSIVNAPGAASYPIAGVTWLLLYQNSSDATKSREIMEFLKWAETEGQKMANGLNFAPLPERVRSRVLNQIMAMAMAPRH
jgi:phosphate transport system substrate-binding protein